MSTFLQAQADYACLLSGLAFLVLAMACQAGGERVRPVRWGWLGWFALSRGLCEWLDLAAMNWADPALPVAAGVILMAGSHLCLFLFGHGLLRRAWPRLPGRWLAIPLVAVAGAGAAAAGWTGLDVAGRYALGLVGGCAAGIGVLLPGRRWDGWQRGWRWTFGAGMALYGVITALLGPQASWPPASAVNERWFAGLTGIPVPLLTGGLALAVMVALEHFGRESERRAGERRALAAALFGNAAPLAAALVLAGGWVLTEWSGREDESRRRAHVCTRAMTAAAPINIQQVQRLQCSAGDASTEDFAYIRRQLRAIRRVNPDTRFVYLTRQVGSKVFFLADAEAEDSKDYSPPGSEYDTVTPGFVGVFRHGQAVTEGPMTDAWGTWVSGLAPIKDPATGAVVAVLGMDTSARDWAHQVARARIAPIGITGLIVLMLIGFQAAARRLRESAAGVAESRLRYRSLVEGSPNAVALFDREGRFVALNSAGQEAMGWDKSEVLGRPFESVWPDTSQPTVRRAVRRVVNGQRASFEAPYVRPDGREMAWQTTLSPVVDSSGFVQRIVGVAVDVTDRRATEEALRQREERLQVVLSGSNEGFWDWNLTTGEVFYSARVIEMLGYSREEFPPRIESWRRLVHPDDQAAAQQALETHLAKGTALYEVECRVSTKSGAWRWMLSRGRVVATDRDCRPVRMAGIIADLTDRKLADEKLLATVVELERFNKLALGREQRIVELKETINQLLARLGEPPRYASASHGRVAQEAKA